MNQFINNKLIKENKEREAKHESSGKLSASMLYQPLRFQVLKTLGVPRKEFDAYALAKFKRGRDVEDWYVAQLEEAGVLIAREEDGQQFAEYRECIGYIDSVIDTDKMQAKVGIIPNEIKSITNAKMRRVKQTGIDWHYKMQACLYALAMNADNYAVTIVSAEDLRSETHIFRTAELKRDVDKAISEYMQAMENWKKDRSLPKFEANPNVKWTANLKYAMFEENWATLPDSWAIQEMERLGIKGE